ncbi:collagen alpha-1(I) chain-like [Dipodomys spectabilis]|uniref:collagen alpha-1(I) chain-like n=1 Tax=Dipodomys spectabilis TaxID=105255 RepID=UPI001C545D70|nr:collagen alpha-1(I) chain-like [Dipodomys spectabilis]
MCAQEGSCRPPPPPGQGVLGGPPLPDEQGQDPPIPHFQTLGTLSRRLSEEQLEGAAESKRLAWRQVEVGHSWTGGSLRLEEKEEEEAGSLSQEELMSSLQADSSGTKSARPSGFRPRRRAPRGPNHTPLNRPGSPCARRTAGTRAARPPPSPRRPPRAAPRASGPDSSQPPAPAAAAGGRRAPGPAYLEAGDAAAHLPAAWSQTEQRAGTGVEVDGEEAAGNPQDRRSAAPPTAPETGVSSETADGVDAGPPARMEALAGRARAGVGREAGGGRKGGAGPGLASRSSAGEQANCGRRRPALIAAPPRGSAPARAPLAARPRQWAPAGALAPPRDRPPQLEPRAGMRAGALGRSSPPPPRSGGFAGPGPVSGGPGPVAERPSEPWGRGLPGAGGSRRKPSSYWGLAVLGVHGAGPRSNRGLGAPRGSRSAAARGRGGFPGFAPSALPPPAPAGGARRAAPRTDAWSRAPPGAARSPEQPGRPPGARARGRAGRTRTGEESGGAEAKLSSYLRGGAHRDALKQLALGTHPEYPDNGSPVLGALAFRRRGFSPGGHHDNLGIWGTHLLESLDDVNLSSVIFKKPSQNHSPIRAPRPPARPAPGPGGGSPRARSPFPAGSRGRCRLGARPPARARTAGGPARGPAPPSPAAEIFAKRKGKRRRAGRPARGSAGLPRAAPGASRAQREASERRSRQEGGGQRRARARGAHREVGDDVRRRARSRGGRPNSRWRAADAAGGVPIPGETTATWTTTCVLIGQLRSQLAAGHPPAHPWAPPARHPSTPSFHPTRPALEPGTPQGSGKGPHCPEPAAPNGTGPMADQHTHSQHRSPCLPGWDSLPSPCLLRPLPFLAKKLPPPPLLPLLLLLLLLPPPRPRSPRRPAPDGVPGAPLNSTPRTGTPCPFTPPCDSVPLQPVGFL